MSQEALIQITRRDFGFVIAKILAILAFRLAVSTGAVAVSTAWMIFQQPSLGRAGFQLLWAPYGVTALVAGFVGFRLWAGVDKFGAGPDDASTNPTVTISRNIVLQALAIGAAVWMLIPLVGPVVVLGKWFFIDQRAATMMPISIVELVQDGVYLAFGIGLLFWARKLTKSEELATTE